MRLTIILFFFSVTWLAASQYSGSGYGSSIKEAKVEALSDLSQTLKAEVSSTNALRKQLDNDDLKVKSDLNVRITSNLPILGAEFTPFEHVDSSVEVMATLYPDKVERLYRHKLDELYKEIEAYRMSIAAEKDNFKKTLLLQKVQRALHEYERYATVAVVVGIKNIKTPTLSKAEAERMFFGLQNDITSMEMAALMLSKPFGEFKKVYLYPPKPDRSYEITPFAKAYTMLLREHINSVDDPKAADYWLKGEYVYGDNGVVLNYNLYDVQSRVNRASNTVTLKPSLYKGYRVKPNDVDFDELLHQGVIVSHGFNVTVTTNKGSEDLLFDGGEEVNILVKLNKPGYFYIVGYTENSEGKFSYLLDFGEFEGHPEFLLHVDDEQANRWMDLGTFTAEAPFGIERLQVVASPVKITALPEHYYDAKTSYYRVGKRLKDALMQTRGLMKKKIAKEKAPTTEAVLTFTTMAP